MIEGGLGVPPEGTLGKNTNAPSSGEAGCEAAAKYIVDLMTQEAAAELRGMPPEKAKEVKDELSITLPLMEQTLYETCLDEKWSAKTIECIQRAKSSAEGEKCIP